MSQARETFTMLGLDGERGKCCLALRAVGIEPWVNEGGGAV